jgi:hypothetical protein
MAVEPPAFRAKPRFCEKNTVKRRKEKNDERKQGHGKRLGSRITLLLTFPAYYPPLGAAAARIQLPIGQGTRTRGKFYSFVSVPSEKNHPSLPIERPN